MSITPLFQRIAIALAVFTTLGILVHDTKFDKAVTLALPVAAISFGIGAHALDFSDNAHTHVERASVGHASSSGQPRMLPRGDYRKYLMAKNFSRNADNFGGSLVLWPSI